MRFTAGLLVVVTLGAGIYLFSGHTLVTNSWTYYLIDDAMISMRFAANLASGHGLRWNPSGEAVEGISNPLWCLWMAVCHLATSHHRHLTALLVAASGAMLLVGAAYQIALSLPRQRHHRRILLLVAISCTYPLWYWSLRGMECSLQLFLLALLWRYGVTERSGSALLMSLTASLAVVVRMDSGIAAGLFWIFSVLLPPRRPISRYALSAAVSLAFLSGLLLLRWNTYHSLLPNTYTLKVAGVLWSDRAARGLSLLATELRWGFGALLLTAVLLVATQRGRRAPALCALLLAFSQIGYSVHVGGDYADQQLPGPNRFILVATPFLLWTIAALAPTLSFTRPKALILFTSCSLALFVSENTWRFRSLMHTPDSLLRADIKRCGIGEWFRVHSQPHSRIAMHAAGHIAYQAEREAIDLLGKVDRTVAASSPKAAFRPGHNKWDYEHSIINLRPDYIADHWGNLEAFLSARNLPYKRINTGVPGGIRSFRRSPD